MWVKTRSLRALLNLKARKSATRRRVELSTTLIAVSVCAPLMPVVHQRILPRVRALRYQSAQPDVEIRRTAAAAHCEANIQKCCSASASDKDA